MGQLGGLLVDAHIAKKDPECLARLITRDEFDSVSAMDDGGDDDAVGFTEFCLLEMIRLVRTNVEQINHIRAQFDMRDGDGNGTLEWQEIRSFQIERIARALEVQRLKTSGLNQQEAEKATKEKAMHELGVLSDIVALKVGVRSPESPIMNYHT